jgi:hypothetical protein
MILNGNQFVAYTKRPTKQETQLATTLEKCNISSRALSTNIEFSALQ